MHRSIRLLGLALLALAVAACSTGSAAPTPTGAPTVDQAKATAIAQNAMQGLAAGDYDVWARDWSPEMKAAIDEAAFMGFRGGLLDAVGAFVSLGAPTLGSFAEGTYRWSFPTTFERGTRVIGFSFSGESPLVVGVRVN